jgi:hypothetical protein
MLKAAMLNLKGLFDDYAANFLIIPVLNLETPLPPSLE